MYENHSLLMKSKNPMIKIPYKYRK